MDHLLKDFIRDLENLEHSIDLLNEIEKLRRISEESYEGTCKEMAIILSDLHHRTTAARTGLQILKGTAILYLAGRFEDFVRTTIEELSSTIARSKSSFNDLPKEMKDALIENTAEVIADPRKYGHGDGARYSFIKNLHENIHLNNLSVINYQCLSITSRNMKHEVVKELFEKTGFKNFWKEVGKHDKIKMYFKTMDDSKAGSEVVSRLDAFMNKRNSIAHPSSSGITWPSILELKDHIYFFKQLSSAIHDKAELHKTTTS